MYGFLKAFLVLMKPLSLSQFYAPKAISLHSNVFGNIYFSKFVR